MKRRSLLTLLALVVACGDDPAPAADPPHPPPNATRLLLTIQQAPRTVVSGGRTDVVVAVARDGNDAYDGDVDVTLAPADGFEAAPATLGREATTLDFALSVSAQRQHGAAELRIVAASRDRKATGDVTLPLLVRGTPGSVDTSFGNGGIFVLGEASAEVTGMVTEPGGKIILGGRIGADAAVVRLSAEGQLDTSYGSGGRARIAIPGLASTHDVVVGPAGSIVLGGNDAASAVLVRFTSAGAADASFGAGGVRVLAEQAASRALATAETNLYVGGRATAAADADGLQVLRLQPSGVREPNWGAAGEALLPALPCSLAAAACPVSALAPKADGRLTVCASRGDGVNVRELFASGAADRNYDLTTAADLLSRCTALANSTPFDVFVAGARTPDVFAIVHLAVPPAGGPLVVESRLFPPFALPAETGIRGATRMVIDDGSLVASADATPGGGPSRLALVRVRANPAGLDARFGDGKGYVTTSVGPTPAFSRALLIQSDGRAIVAGTNGDMIAVRYWL